MMDPLSTRSHYRPIADPFQKLPPVGVLPRQHEPRPGAPVLARETRPGLPASTRIVRRVEPLEHGALVRPDARQAQRAAYFGTERDHGRRDHAT